ncbi:glycoside hydrolase family 11 protein, partial [Streptomyces murinus]
MSTLTRELRRRRGLVAAVQGLVAAAVAVVVAFVLTGPVQAATTITSNSTGTNNGYFYSFWEQSSGATMTLGSGSNYSLTWNTASQNVVAGTGWNPGTTNTVSYSGTWNCNGNCYLSLYGWTTNPLIEWYIVDNYGNYNPSSGATKLGSVSSDGSTYDLYKTTRVDAPSIEGTATFDQYWAVRQSKRTGGTITVSNIFNAWKSLGLNLGTPNYEILATEGYQSSGSSNITVTSGGGGTTPPPTTPPPTTPPPSGSGCSATFTNSSDWGSGFTGSVAVKNNGSAAINGWTVKLTFPGNQTVSSLWNGSYTQSGNTVTVKNASNN